MTKCNFQSIRIYSNFPTITGWKCCQILTFCIRYIYIYIYIYIYLYIYIEILPGRWSIEWYNNYGIPLVINKYKQFFTRAIKNTSVCIRRVTNTPSPSNRPSPPSPSHPSSPCPHPPNPRFRASMEVYVENPAVLELILLYRATKYKQTKRPGC